jgi:hypothetical protein
MEWDNIIMMIIESLLHPPHGLTGHRPHRHAPLTQKKQLTLLGRPPRRCARAGRHFKTFVINVMPERLNLNFNY